jgi:hypothetical protein
MLNLSIPLDSQVLRKSFGKLSSLYIILSFTAQSDTLWGGIGITCLTTYVVTTVHSRYAVMVHFTVQMVLYNV